MSKSYVMIGVGVIIVATVIGGAWWYVASNRPPSFGATTATRGNVIASLDEPGSVLTENDADLSFQESGQIAALNVNEGQAVSAGTVLVSLDQSSLAAGLQQANAGLAVAQANLAQIASGTRPEQLAIDQTAVGNALATLNVDVLTAYSSADDAIHNQTDNLFQSPINNNPTFLVPQSNSQLQTNIQSQRLVVGATLADWYAASNASSSDAVSLGQVAMNALTQIKSYLDMIGVALENIAPSSTGLPAATIAGYKANLVTARTEVGAAITTLTGAESVLQAAQGTLTLAAAGATPQQLEAQQAAVAEAQAQVTSAQVALDHASLIAPFAGTVQNLTAKVGQVVTPGVPVLSLTNNTGLKIEAYVSEADVANVKAGNAANVTLDAYGTGTVFPATVATVDSAETVVNGTPSYMVTLHFVNADSRIKDGMTGSVHLITAEHDNVVEVPSRLVVNDGTNNYVLVQNGGTDEKRAVTVGLTGDDGMTEIVSGVNVGDTLVNF